MRKSPHCRTPAFRALDLSRHYTATGHPRAFTGAAPPDQATLPARAGRGKRMSDTRAREKINKFQ